MGFINLDQSLIHRCGQCHSTSVDYITRPLPTSTLVLMKCRACGHERVLSVTSSMDNPSASITYTHTGSGEVFEDF
jgi:hypothetical protein